MKKKRAITCITPYKTTQGYHNGSFYKVSGIMHTHEFLIGCDDGSLMLIEAITIDTRYMTRVEKLGSVRGKEWNGGEAIECVAVHPSLPLFASGSRDHTNLWDIDHREAIESLPLQPAVAPVRPVGFNQRFLAVCGSGGVRVYSCDSDDYRDYREELQSRSKIADFGTDLMLSKRQGMCPICLEDMSDPSTQSAIRHGPKETREKYLTCGHLFHEKCIEQMYKDGGKKCPMCRDIGRLEKVTPHRVIQSRQEQSEQQSEQQAEQAADSISKTLQDRSRRFLDFGQDTTAATALAIPASQGAVALTPVPEPAPVELTPQQLRDARLKYFKPGSQGGRRNKNKYSKKKNSLKKSKFLHCYSKKNKKY